MRESVGTLTVRYSTAPVQIGPARLAKRRHYRAELRMDPGAVIALVVVLAEDFPIGRDFITNRGADGQLAERVALQPVRYAVQLSGQRPRLGRRQIQEDETAPCVDADRIQMVILFFETVGGAQVRSGDQRAVEIVRPLVVGAHDHAPGGDSSRKGDLQGCGLFRGAAQTRASMPADIVERPQLAFAIAHQQNALAEYVEHSVIAGIGQLRLAARRNPLAAEYALLFDLKYLGVAVPGGGQAGFQLGGAHVGKSRV